MSRSADPRATRRVVALVGNPAIHDSRVLREAETLASAGHRVTLLARWEPGLPREEQARGFQILRLEIPRLLARRAEGTVRDGIRGGRFGLAALPGVLRMGRWLRSRRDETPLRFAVRRSHSAARSVLPKSPAVYHAHDLDMLPVAARLAAEGSGALVYDSHELYVDGRSLASLPPWLRWVWRRYERSLIRRCDAVVTVNESMAEALQRMHGLRERPVVVRNCPARWRAECEVPRPDKLRAALGIPEHQRIVLYVGAFLTGRGIEELLSVMMQDQFTGTAAVFLGYGPLRPAIERAMASPPLRDRLYLAGPAKPADLLEWVASADVSVACIQPTCESYRLSSPNKLFESLAAGTPVVGSRLPEFERVIGTDGSVGALVDPASPESLGRAIRRILELPPEQYEAMRRRARRLALETYNWEIESQKLLRLYDAPGDRTSLASA